MSPPLTAISPVKVNNPVDGLNLILVEDKPVCAPVALTTNVTNLSASTVSSAILCKVSVSVSAVQAGNPLTNFRTWPSVPLANLAGVFAALA